jgi:hypothetical protein
MKTKTWKLRLVAFFLVVLLTFILLEISTRLYCFISNRDINNTRPSFYFTNKDALADKRRFKSHPFLPYSPIENDSRKIIYYRSAINQNIIYDYTQNSLGFRTPETSFEKPIKTKRIITLGGSTTWDGRVNDSTWPALLEKKLNVFYRNYKYKIEIINLAVDGANSATSLLNLSMLGVMYHPDLVISYDGVNDFSPSQWKNVIPDYRNKMQKFNDNTFSFQFIIPKWMFKSYFISIFSYIIDKKFAAPMHIHAQIYKDSDIGNKYNTVSEGIYLYERNLRLMRGIANEYHCKFLGSIAHWVNVNQKLNAYDDSLRIYYKNQSINYLDLQNMLPHNDYSIHVDDVHWTTKGLQLVAETWLKKIVVENLLEIDTILVTKNHSRNMHSSNN